MKKTLILAVTVAMAFVSCKKDDDNNSNNGNPSPTQTKTQLISAKSWKGVSLTVGGADFWSQLDDCDKDDIYIFKADGVYVADAGATKCDPGDPQQYTDTWKFIENETKLVYDGDTTIIKELTSSKMVLQGDYGGITAEATFQAQ
jgi:hypothetical protein